MSKSRQVASLAIKSPGKMLAVERKDIAAWLKSVAAHLIRHGKAYTEGRFTSRYANRRPVIRRAVRRFKLAPKGGSRGASVQ